MRRAALLALAALALAGCGKEEAQGPKAENYASVKLDALAYSNELGKKVEELLKNGKLPPAVKAELVELRSFLRGTGVSPEEALKALNTVLKFQREKGVELFSPEEIKELKEVIKVRATYRNPVVA
ncbi:ATPase [Thermovibrio ammonificans]|uniref:ATPase n=1 Tax=Thermovibrio ammonificans (strain DSM 15698 / JCM 12110 / HB-1) TaxID=648996 RepID=E8T3A8_THEA1|nr:ATPase [Thermovibrio ammonificans]ADU97240.1 ATPase [Thermovibrio ammonificans HB-1]